MISLLPIQSIGNKNIFVKKKFSINIVILFSGKNKDTVDYLKKIKLWTIL